MIPIKFPKDQKDQLTQRVKAYFENERSETIGNLAAEELLDYMIKELGPYLYNKGIDDARTVLQLKAAQMEDELYALERPATVTSTRNEPKRPQT